MENTILIAEDDRDDAALLQQTLKAAGVLNPTALVTDGDQVIAYLTGEGRYSDQKAFPFPAMLLLDLKMPRMDGFQVLAFLTKRPDVKPHLVVALTGFQEYKDAQKAYQLGADSFLSKPCTTEDILNLKRAFATRWEFLTPRPDDSSGAQRRLG